MIDDSYLSSPMDSFRGVNPNDSTYENSVRINMTNRTAFNQTDVPELNLKSYLIKTNPTSEKLKVR